MTVHQHQGPNRHPRSLHIDQYIADAAMLGRVRVGPNQHENPVCVLRARSPDLLAVNDEIVALGHGLGLQTGQVRARTGLGIPLTPDIIAVQYPLEEAFLLFVRAPVHERRTAQGNAGVAG